MQESNSHYGSPNYKTSSSYNEKSMNNIQLNKTFPSSFDGGRKIYGSRGSDFHQNGSRGSDFNQNSSSLEPIDLYNYICPKSPKSPKSPKGRILDRENSVDSISTDHEMNEEYQPNNCYPIIGVSPNGLNNYVQKRSTIPTYGDYSKIIDINNPSNISVHDPSGNQMLIDSVSYTYSHSDLVDDDDDSDLPDNFKLPASKSPIIEALVYCSLRRWGIDIVECSDESSDGPAKVVFKVLDFEKYYKCSRKICSKQHPTEDISSREKSLRRWFKSFPKKKIRKESPIFILEIKNDLSKKVYDIIEKYKCLMKTKRRN